MIIVALGNSTILGFVLLGMKMLRSSDLDKLQSNRLGAEISNY